MCAQMQEKSCKPAERANEGRQWTQVLGVIVIAIGCMSVGFMWSWSSPFSMVLSQDKVNYDITEADTANFLIFQPLGMIFTSFFFFKLSEYLGTKKSIWILAIPHLISWIIVLFAVSKWDFYASRFMAGMGDTIFFCAGPPYIGEITTPKVRGYCGFIPVMATFFGSLLITVLGSYVDIKTTSYICMVPSLLFIGLMSFLPETPHQLIKDGKLEQAKSSLKWLLRKPDIEEDFLSLKADVEQQLADGGTFRNLVTISNNRRALRAGLLLRCGQQFSGVSIFLNYAQMIFQMAGSNLSPQISSIIFLTTSGVCGLACSAGIEKFGRRPALTLSTAGCGVILLVMSVYFALDQYHVIPLDALSWFPLAGMLAYVMMFSTGLGIVPTVMLGELFTGNMKYKSLAVLALAFGVAVFIASNIFTLLTTYVGLYGPFFVYGISCLATMVLGLKWVPETKGKTLAEIQLALKK
ncbi:facilitated trehalose transporter Tret1 isoform X1 [Dendroctonus ponderosae]|uniref:Major facilitator superfamily (MFS) profile domain-containing protein n=2 Tax=Dendroctonus ponderosae TaxID=77166 RepID=J3JU52_DENPD|nr:facilitated trehalose transporter Tret1 isoform X1 [Dendroctonus ponderosae]AEE61726.1 unknown [Dendroctonus ponderosae]KAH1026950.1 hypothetical protein HUJ05_000539 [Dendroctonus ponderosae]